MGVITHWPHARRGVWLAWWTVAFPWALRSLNRTLDVIEARRADQRAVGALLAAPMPEVESIHKGAEWAERYGEWWHEHVRPHLVGQP